MASQVAPAAVGAGETGTDFDQKGISSADAEQFMLPSDAYDPTINSQPLDVYLYWAAIEREREAKDTLPPADSPWTVLFKRITRRSHTINYGIEPMPAATTTAGAEPDGWSDVKEKDDDASGERTSMPDRPAVSAQEYERAYRALRVASWQAVFYLITTDILGPASAPAAFNQLGYGPGIIVYTCFYLLAVCAGQVIWKLYLHLDSSRFPVKGYADLGERVFGRKIRHVFNFFQSFQLLFNVALLIIGNGQTLVTLINWKFCYLALNVFLTIVGILGGQIRSLKNFSWFANVNIWLNIAVIVVTIAGIWSFPPVPSQSYHANLDQPVIVSGWVPSYTIGWYQQVSGVQYAIFAYGGAMIFPEFMAEMRRPRDFWKSALCAQLFCYLMYMFFGLIVYLRQGQYTSILPGLDFDNRALILVNNIVNLIALTIAAVLYGNIGVKVFYENVLRAYLKAPPMLSSKGRFLWSFTTLVYWVVAWVVGSAIPNISALVTLVGAACILQFTYTFPPALLLGFWMQRDAMQADRPWTPGIEPGSNRIDTWRDFSRWKRGFRKYWYLKSVLVLLHLAAWANCALGLYAGIKTAEQAYASGYNVPFSCYAPNDPKVQNPNSG